MSKKYTPPKSRVDELVKRHTPDQLAVAYLRAARRAREAETAFSALSDLVDAGEAARRGSGEDVKQALDSALKTLRTLNETDEV